MDDIASLGLRIDAAQAVTATAALDKMAAAGGRAEASANKLATAEQRLEKSTGAAADAALDAVRAAQLLAGEQEAVIGTANRLNAAHGKVINTSKVLQQTTLNLSRQVADIGTQLGSGQSPLLILIQQGPQIADAFAYAATQGLSFKAALAGVRAQALGLIATFGPWIAGVTAVGAGIFYLWNQHEKAKKKAEELTKQIDDMTKALEKSVPSLVDQANSSEVAAEGARNFEAWLAKSNASLATYAERLKTATVNQYMLAAATAKATADELREANTRKTARAVVYTGGGGAEGLRRYQAELAQAEENLRLADARAKAAMDAPLKAFTDNHSKAAKAVKETTREIGLFTDVVVAEKEIWPERDAAMQAAEKQTKALKEAQQALNDSLSKADRPATALENLITELDRVIDRADLARNAVDDIYYGIRNRDWAGAFAGLLRTIEQIKVAFDRAASSKDRMSAAAGVAQGVGNAIGGSTGSAIAGAASGALTGFTVAGPVGAVVGGLIGGISSLFGSSKAKKQAKAEAEAQRLAQEQARLLEIANQARQIEIEKIRLTQGELAAELARRDDVLKAMATENQAAQKELWNLQDAAAAKAAADAKASEIATQRKDLEIQLLEAMGKTDEVAKLRLADERALIDESLRGLFDQVQAERELTAARDAATEAAQRAKDAAASLLASQQADAANLVSAARASLKAAYEAQVAEITAGRDQMAGYAQSFREFRLGLSGAAASGANFYAIAAKARLGDTDAMGQLVGAAQAANSSAMSGASTQVEFLREQARIRAAVQAAEDTATRQVSIADQQLSALTAQVSALGILNESTLTVAAGIAGVISAINILNGTFGGALANPGRSWGANPDANMALARQTGFSGDFGGGGFQAWIMQQDEATKAKAREILAQQGQAYRIAFATGGSFTVGGDGGTDTTPVSFMATRNEVVNVSREDVMAALLDETRALRAEVAALRPHMATTAANTGKTASVLNEVTRGGDSMLIEAVA